MEQSVKLVIIIANVNHLTLIYYIL